MDKFLSGKITDRYNTPTETEKDMAQLVQNYAQVDLTLDTKVDKYVYEADKEEQENKLRMSLQDLENKSRQNTFIYYRQVVWLVYCICNNAFVRFLNLFGHWYVIDFANSYGCYCTIRAPKDKEDFRYQWKLYRSDEGKRWRKLYENDYKAKDFEMDNRSPMQGNDWAWV